MGLRKLGRALADLTTSIVGFADSKPKAAESAIFLIAVAVRLLILVGADTWPDKLTWEMTRVAQSLARGEGFSNPFAPGPTGPSAHIAPLYPLVLAAIYHIFGTGEAGDLVKQLFSISVSAAVYAMLPRVAVVARFPRYVGFLGGLFGAVTVSSIELEVIGRWEAHFATLLFLIAVWLWFSDLKSGRLSLSRGAAAGVVWGALLLTSPVFITVLAGLMVVAVAFYGAHARRAALYFCGMFIAIVLTLTPWSLRNYSQFGEIFFVRNNAGLEFYVSNVHGARMILSDNMLNAARPLHPNTSPAVCARVAAIGELAFNRECMAKFKELLRSDPGHVARLVLRRLIWMWIPIGDHPIQDRVLGRDLLLSAFSLLGLLGLFRLPKELDFTRWTFAAILLCYPLVYYFVQTATRYRFPIIWITCLLSANLVLGSLKKFGVIRPDATSEPYLSTRLSSMS